MSDPLAAARVLLAEDPDAETRAELEALVSRVEGGDEAAGRDLADRMTGPLEFGTAGLRGRVEAGLSRMNRLAVVKATWGLGTFLLDERARGGPDPRSRGVAVAFDGRHSSRGFAEEAASVLNGLAIPVRLFPDPVPTPLLSFSVPHFGAAAGIAVTASHNPPRDNGYKVYLPSGAQLVPPVDAAIAACIAEAPHLDTIARPAPADAAAHGLRLLVDAEDTAVEEAYLGGLARAALHPIDGLPLRIAYTAMHGVGHRLAIRALARAGFEGVATEAAQADPDGAFRTVPFPNPEEPGAMDRVLSLGQGDPGRAGPRQRPRRGPAGGRRGRPLDPRLPDALRQRGRGPSGRRRDRARRDRREAEARGHDGRLLEPPVAHWPATGVSRAARR